jgi:hypothetical protein
MFYLALLEFGIINQHYALNVTSLFITQAPTCFGTYMPFSGSVLYPSELLVAVMYCKLLVACVHRVL